MSFNLFQSIQQTQPFLSLFLGLGLGAIATKIGGCLNRRRWQERQQIDEFWLQSVEESLQQSEAGFRAIFEQAAVGIVQATLDGTYLRVNQRFCELLGYQESEIIGRSYTHFTCADDRPKCHARIQELFANKTFSTPLEKRFIDRNGQAKWVTVSLSLVRQADDSPDYIIGIIEDIHGRKAVEQVIQTQAALDRALNEVTQVIRNSLDAATIFSTAVLECAKLLHTTHAVLVKYYPDQHLWRDIAFYSDAPNSDMIQHLEISDLDNPVAAQLKQGEIVRIDNTDQFEDAVNQSIAERIPGSWLILPIRLQEVWGALTLVKTEATWQDSEVELAKAIANQLAIAIQQSELYQQVQQLNTHLELQVEERTAVIQKALIFESLLKRITDKVRDSLDENQILQTAVNELGSGLNVICCNAALYSDDGRSHKITHEYSTQASFGLGQELLFADCSSPEIFAQLSAGQKFQLCCSIASYTDYSPNQYFSIFACPLQDNQDVLGDLWVFRPPESTYTDLEMRVVQQVANQCAIALRQSRLYQVAQAQVDNLERLNQLKDDFLNTVSHELRTPMSNIKMATQMLEINLEQMGMMATMGDRVSLYLQILQDECKRETNLINDLLDLSRLDSNSDSLMLQSLNLQYWLPHVAEVFSERMRTHHRSLVLDIADSLPALTTDFTYLELITMELLHNACKYTPSGGTIKVSASQHLPSLTDSDRIVDTLQIEIANSGVEIPVEELSHVFDKFYRVPNNDPWKHGGTGLGLALVKKRVERLQGAITVTSANQWTAFILQLPLQSQ